MIKEKISLAIKMPSQYLNEISRFESKITFITDIHGRFNAKSFLSILAANLHKAKEIEILIEGPDEKDALNYIKSLQ